MDNLIVVRGAGDIATGTISLLHRCGFKLVVLETERPTAIRRFVALSEAVYAGSAQVEDVRARLVAQDEALSCAARGEIPVIIDPEMKSLAALKPAAVVDAVLAKRNLGLTKDAASFTVALGPGFVAGEDCHAVIETNRGHDLGRIIYKGCAEQNTGIPGVVAGVGKERVIHAPVGGKLRIVRDIGDLVEKNEVIAIIDETEVFASIPGLIRGMLRDGFSVKKGLKMADIDPRYGERKNCSTISDKARCVAAGVLGALMERGIRP